MALWGAVMGHGNLVYHAAGWLEGGLVASFEKFVIDVEVIQHLSEMLKPIDTSVDELAVDAISEIEPNGHFFGAEHTIKRYESAFYTPFLSDWQNNENWQAAGAKDTTRRATEIWQSVLENFEPPKLDDDRRDALSEYVQRRKREIGTKEV